MGIHFFNLKPLVKQRYLFQLIMLLFGHVYCGILQIIKSKVIYSCQCSHIYVLGNDKKIKEGFILWDKLIKAGKNELYSPPANLVHK